MESFAICCLAATRASVAFSASGDVRLILAVVTLLLYIDFLFAIVVEIVSSLAYIELGLCFCYLVALTGTGFGFALRLSRNKKWKWSSIVFVMMGPAFSMAFLERMFFWSQNYLYLVLPVEVVLMGMYAPHVFMFLAALGGTVGIVASAITGTSLFTPRYSTMFGTPLVLNKIMWMIFALELWITFLVLRIRFGGGLWNNRFLGGLYVALAVAGFLFVMLAGSLGGELAGKGTILEPFYQMVGFDPNEPLLLPPVVCYAEPHGEFASNRV